MEMATPGQPFDASAKTHNEIARAVNLINGRFFTGGKGAETSAASIVGDVEVKNSSGANRDQFDILGIDDSFWQPDNPSFKSRIILDGVTPDIDDHAGKFVILTEPVVSGQFGRAAASGVCICKVDVQDEAHQFADVYDGDCTKLKSNPAGSARILWKETGTGTKWAIVLLGNGDPPIPDPTKNHIRVYDATAKKVKWITSTNECPGTGS